MVRCPTDLKEMAATVHAGCYWGMQLEQCRSGGVGPVSELQSAASEPWAIDLLNAPEMEHCVAADRQRCCTEKSFFKSMAKLLAMLLPIVAHDVAC